MRNLISTLIIIFILWMIPNRFVLNPGISSKTTTIYNEHIKSIKIDKDWELFVLALTWIESTHVPDIINKTSGALGMFQIMPKGKNGYLDEANRILNEEKYTNVDCFNTVKAREIFDIIQEHKNPNKSIIKAIKIHNPNADDAYKAKILVQMEKQEWVNQK